ncbi:MAG: PKD domain-containing protein [Thermoplasmata archaeon]|nr:PKD domain-containing protein [Thermoplasmata archaeon]
MTGARASVALVFAILGLGLLATAIGPAGAVHSGVPPQGVTLTADPSTGVAPLRVAFQLTLPPNTTMPALSWSFGDGSYLNGSDPAYLAPVHDFVRSGTFRTVATATWPAGAVNASLTISVLLANLTVGIRANVTTGTVPLTVSFAGTAAGGTGTFVSFLWSFGTGDSGNGPAILYTFLSAGHFLVSLAVSDSQGDAGRTSVWVNVSAAPQSNGSNGTDPTGGTGGRGGSGSHPWDRLLPGGAWFPGLLTVLVAGVFVAVLLGLWVRSRRGPGSAPPPPSGRDPELPAGTVTSAPPPPLEVPSGIGSDLSSPAVPAEPPASGPTGRLLPAGLTQERQIANRLIRHLAELPRLAPGDTPGPDRTQAGLVTALGAGQSAVSRVLRQLELGGVVSVQTGHVVGSSRRVKVYQLTPRGERLGHALRESPARP